jgi:Concanavalin A-like lectin/glucanases superfamily
MTQIASLPLLRVEVAFNPTDLLNLTQTWTEITPYVRDFGTHGGRQHYLDRIEASTLSMTLNNRTGFFMNGSVNGTGAIIGTRLPIRVLSGWPQKSITAISGSGSTVTYTVSNTYIPGQQVLVAGSNIDGYNGYFTVATASLTQFTVTSTVTGTADLANYPTLVGNAYTIFWGVIDTIDTSLQDALNSDLYLSASDSLKYLSLRYLYNTTLFASYANIASARSWYNTANRNTYVDNIGAYNGSIVGLHQSTEGVLLYDKTTSVDLTNGSTDNTAYVQIPVATSGSSALDSGIEFWVIGQGIVAGTLLGINLFNPGGFLMDVSIVVDGAGQVVTTSGLDSNTVINDGYWHHIALIVDHDTGKLTLIVDGAAVASSATYFGGYGFTTTGIDSQYHIADNQPCYIDQIVISDNTVTATEVKNRYAAGSLLREDANAADRIAQALVIGGRGTIASGAVSVSNYFVNGSTYTPGATSNGTILCQGTLAPVTTSSVLDSIFEAVDTEIGVFYQGDDGVLNFHTRAYPYLAAGNATPSGAYVWTDDTTSTYHYEAPSFQLTRDDVDTWTTVIVSPTNGTPQIYENTANQTRWGQSTLTKSSTATTLDAAYQTAVYLGHVFATPLARVNTLKLKSETDNGSNLDAMLGVNLQDRITVKRTPINASAAGITNTDMSVESTNHEFAAEPGFWHTTFTLDPYPIRFSTQSSPTYFLIADNATYGKSDLDVAL